MKPDKSDEHGISASTRRRLELAAGELATQAVTLMDQRLPWFRTLSASHRSSVTLVAQAGISGYLDWLKGPEGTAVSTTGAIFSTAPRELLRTVSLRRTVELVRIAIAVAEEHFPPLSATDAERTILTDTLLRYSREVAFTAAAIYATAAETRGAWDDRLEAMMVDAIVRGEGGDGLASRAAALNWDPARPVLVMAGRPKPLSDESIPRIEKVSVLSGRHSGRLILVVSAPSDAELAAATLVLIDQFGPGSVVYGPTASGLDGAIDSARHALAGLRAAVALPEPPRGVQADALWPERALAGDAEAADLLRRGVFDVLIAAGPGLLETLDAYLASGRALEQAARILYVHTNTVRYRLRRIHDLTGFDPWAPHDSFSLQIAVILGRLGRPSTGRATDPVV